MDDRCDRRGTQDMEELQFGHSVAAVKDKDNGQVRRQDNHGFNSATASPPWMTLRRRVASRPEERP